METKDLVIEATVAFKSNKGNFDHQPVFTLTNNPGLTGDDFISLYRIRRSTLPSQGLSGTAVSADGRIGLTIGSSQGITSLTGSTRIKAQSLTAGAPTLTADWAAGPNSGTLISTTSTTWLPVYNIIINQTDTSKIEVITLEEEENRFTSDLTITGLPTLADMKVMGNGVRPLGKQTETGGTTPTGEEGKAEILTYLYNRMEVQNSWTSSGLTGVYDRSFNGLSGALMGKAAGKGAMQTGGNPGAGTATVTGWSLGPIEGGFRLDNGGYIKTNRLAPNASLFNTRDEATSGMTFMTYARFHATGSTQNIITIAGDETNPAFTLSFKGNGEQADTGIIEFSNYLSSITAGSITASDNTMAGAYPIKLNRWYHIAGKVSAIGDLSGLSLYINGEKTTLARSTSSVSGTGPAAATGNIVAMASPTNPLAFFGSDKAGNGAVVAHDLSLTRIFTRGLSDSEVFQNYIATVPGNITLKSFKIG
tara:strand:+ start:403 stop:1836 length:1434 start_codon:yes stop_codon:yes gene_type:complete